MANFPEKLVSYAFAIHIVMNVIHNITNNPTSKKKSIQGANQILTYNLTRISELKFAKHIMITRTHTHAHLHAHPHTDLVPGVVDGPLVVEAAVLVSGLGLQVYRQLVGHLAVVLSVERDRV